jgi:hypothetical protein
MNAVLRMDPDECRGAAMVNLRINRRGEFDYSRPCGGCHDMLRGMGFSEAFHTDRRGRFVSMEIGPVDAHRLSGNL